MKAKKHDITTVLVGAKSAGNSCTAALLQNVLDLSRIDGSQKGTGIRMIFYNNHKISGGLPTPIGRFDVSVFPDIINEVSRG